VRQIVDYLNSVRNDFVIVLGDFNDWLPGRSAAHVMDERLGRPPQPVSFPARWPVMALDRIWVRPLPSLQKIFVHRSRLARQASDHLPVVAEIDANAAASTLVSHTRSA
jgi:endonuclease/exonuclease/phosphatase family metal-dependent hydrolase